MKKKITLAILITLLAAVSLTGIATAQTDSPPDGERQGTVGQITALGTSSFSMTTVRGEDITVQVTDETIYKNRDGSDASFSDLTVGRWVAGRQPDRQGRCPPPRRLRPDRIPARENGR